MSRYVFFWLTAAVISLWGVLHVLRKAEPNPASSPPSPAASQSPAVIQGEDPFAAVLKGAHSQPPVAIDVTERIQSGKDPFREFLEKQKVSPFGSNQSDVNR